MNTNPSPATEDRCHCGSESVKTSDHCDCCGCEQFETTCSHVCDGESCSMEHDLCRTCVTDNKRWTGSPVTESERRDWALWGCTCTPESSDEAQAWMDLVTR